MQMTIEALMGRRYKSALGCSCWVCLWQTVADSLLLQLLPAGQGPAGPGQEGDAGADFLRQHHKHGTLGGQSDFRHNSTAFDPTIVCLMSDCLTDWCFEAFLQCYLWYAKQTQRNSCMMQGPQGRLLQEGALAQTNCTQMLTCRESLSVIIRYIPGYHGQRA